MSVDKQILAYQGSVGYHNKLPCPVGIQTLMDTASYPTKAELSTAQIRKVLQQHFFNSKADTFAVAIDLGNVLKGASKNICILEQFYLPISTSVTCTDPQGPGPSAFLIGTAESPENITGDLDTHKLAAAERDIPIE